MPYATTNDVSLRYEVDGDGPAVVLCGEIGFGAWQFGWQHGALAGPYRVATPETRGIGDSDAPPGPYSIRGLASDVDAILSDLGVRTAHLVGYGLGGMVALQYAMESERAESLAVVGTPPAGDGLNARALWADPDDPRAVETTLEAALSSEFQTQQPDVLRQITEWRVAEDASEPVWDAQHAALEEFDIADRLYELTTPTKVLHGTEDDVCPTQYGETLAEGLPRGEFVPVSGAGHLAHVEQSRTVNDELLGWLDEQSDREI